MQLTTMTKFTISFSVGVLLSVFFGVLSDNFNSGAFILNTVLLTLIVHFANSEGLRALLNHYFWLIKTKDWRQAVVYLREGIILKNSNLLNVFFTSITAYNIVRFTRNSLLEPARVEYFIDEFTRVQVANGILFVILITGIGTLQKTLEKLKHGSKLHW